MMSTAEPLDGEREAVRRSYGARFAAVAVFVVVGVALALFDFFSLNSETANRGFDGHSAPVYGQYRPNLSAMAWIAVGVAIAAAVATVLMLRAKRTRPWVAVAVGVGILFTLSLSLAVARPDRQGIPGRTVRVQAGEYQVDVGLVDRLGPYTFVRDYPQIVPQLRSHSITHPPGALLLLYALQDLSPAHLIPRALALGLLASLVVGSTWLVARHFADESTANIAALLIAVAPGPAILTFTCMDALFAAVLGLVAALFVWGKRSGNTRIAFVAGLAAGFAAFVTYAVSFIAIFGAIWFFVRLRRKQAATLLAWSAGGALLAVALMRLAGFDVLASYHAFSAAVAITPFQRTRPYLYWIFGEYAVWLTYVGLPIAAAVVFTLFTKRRAFLLAVFVPIAIFYALPTHVTKLIPGETERTWLFLLPFAAAAAAASFKSLVPPSKRAWIMGALVLFAALQAVLLNALWLNFY